MPSSNFALPAINFARSRPGFKVCARVRDMLLHQGWHYRFLPHTNVVDVHMGKLRRKVDAPGEPPMILSVRGAGFMLRIPGVT